MASDSKANSTKLYHFCKIFIFFMSLSSQLLKDGVYGSVAEPEPPFLAGAGAKNITQFHYKGRRMKSKL